CACAPSQVAEATSAVSSASKKRACIVFAPLRALLPVLHAVEPRTDAGHHVEVAVDHLHGTAQAVARIGEPHLPRLPALLRRAPGRAARAAARRAGPPTDCGLPCARSAASSRRRCCARPSRTRP